MLYRRIGGRKRTVHLKMTNVLTHDALYQAVVEVYEAWSRHVRPGDLSAEERWQREQRAAKGHDLLSLLVVARALDVLGVEPVDPEQPLTPGRTLALQGACGALVLSWDAEHTLRIEDGLTGAALRIVALPAHLDCGRSTLAWLEDMGDDPVLVLYLAADKPLSDATLREHTSGPGPVRRPLVLVPVAPWRLDSVERVARALRWHFGSASHLAYPFGHDLDQGWTDPGGSPEWIEVEGRTLSVLRPPRNGHVWAPLEDRLVEEQHEVERVRTKLDALERRQNENRKHLRHELDEAERALARDERALESLHAMRAQAIALLACPVCHERADVWDFEGTGRAFRVECPSCGTTWGVRHCQSCGGRVPFVDLSDNEPGAALTEVDDRYGCDVLALPVEAGVYWCPECGGRTDGE